jgi:heptosyltransferase-3
MTAALALPERPNILVITLRRLGDVLLTTPLIRSLRHGFPGARIDMLVFAGTEGVLAGNRDVDSIAILRPDSTLGENLALFRSIARRYDLAVSTQTGDRPTLLAFVAARRRIGLAPAAGGGRWWKTKALHRAVPANPKNHRVEELLRLADAVGIDRHREVVCPRAGSSNRIIPRGRYAVLHANPMFRYKRWTDAAWRALARELARRGMIIVSTGSNDPREKAYLDAVWGSGDTPVARLDGQLDWPELANLLDGAALYVGTDTAVTHLAAAAGCPTVAVFGPTDPRLWGPWPAGGLDEPWSAGGPIQRRANIWLVQQELPCVPCQKEGCERHLDSHAACLDMLSVADVLLAADQALDEAASAARYAAMRA